MIMTDNEIIKALELCLKNECEKCFLKDSETCQIDLMKLLFDLINRQKKEIERLKTIAKKMHTWIFVNSYDEEKAYAECGLTDEENVLLGYCGKIVFESKEKVGD